MLGLEDDICFTQCLLLTESLQQITLELCQNYITHAFNCAISRR